MAENPARIDVLDGRNEKNMGSNLDNNRALLSDDPRPSPDAAETCSGLPAVRCAVCGAASFLHDKVDFNKSCLDPWGKSAPLTEILVEYYRCPQCQFCFVPEMSKWSFDDFERRIYNESYLDIDPDYLEARPRANAESLVRIFAHTGQTLDHLDYGGGDGLLSDLLRRAGWRSKSYDPFVDRNLRLEELGRFDFITAFEVFEHVPDPQKLMNDISTLLRDEGILLFSTLLNDGCILPDQRLDWWYASPRNGHISLYSRQSLSILASTHGFQLRSFHAGAHLLWRKVPDWGNHLVNPS
jgi:SAM-dependent methyltransferase